MNVAVTNTRTETAEVLIERAHALVPVLRQRAAQTNAQRKLPQETVDDFRRLGLTRCLQPPMFGGYGSNYRVFSRILRTLAQGCGSTAWVCGVHGEHSWVIGQFSEAAQHEVWDGNPLAVASASFPPTGTVERAPGGHRLNGKWSYASGVDHAHWLLLNAGLTDGSSREERLFLVPAGAVEIVDDWHVMGMSGTGSKSVLLKDVLVPATHSVSLHELKTGTGPGAAVHADNPLYRSPRTLFASFSLTSVNVGLAERAVAEFIESTRSRQSRGVKVAELESVQLKLAEAAVQLETAVMLVEQTIERNIALMEAGTAITAEQVARTRRNSSYATLLSRMVVSSVFEIAGGSALYAGHPLQDIFRDTLAGTSHLSLTWHRTAPAYSQIQLGLPVDFDTL